MAIQKRNILENETYTIEITTGFANMILFSAKVNKFEGDRITGKVNGRSDDELINYCISKLDTNYSLLKNGLNLTSKLEKIERAALQN